MIAVALRRVIGGAAYSLRQVASGRRIVASPQPLGEAADAEGAASARQ
jgi:hypothetical protein